MFLQLLVIALLNCATSGPCDPYVPCGPCVPCDRCAPYVPCVPCDPAGFSKTRQNFYLVAVLKKVKSSKNEVLKTRVCDLSFIRLSIS